MKIFISLLLILISLNAGAQDNRTIVLRDLEKSQVLPDDVRLTGVMKQASRLFGEKDDLTSVIVVVPKGSVVDILGSDTIYLHVFYEEMEGYIFKRHAEINEAPAVTKPVVRPAEDITVGPVDESRQTVSRFSYLENKYGSSMAARLMSGKIWNGMDAEMVTDSWGKPQKINRVISGNKIKEEWIYRNTWLYMEDDNLVQWGPVGNR